MDKIPVDVTQRERENSRVEQSPSDQIYEVYGGMNTSSRSVLTVILTILLIIFSILSMIFAKYYLLIIFVPLLIILLISAVVRSSSKRKYTQIKSSENIEPIFKDHKE